MRVLYLGPYPPPNGGVQTHLVALRRIALDRGHHVEVVNITRHRKAPGDGVHYPRSALGVIKILFTQRWDVLHLHAGGDLTKRILALALTLTLVPRTKTVFTFHSGGFPGTDRARRSRPWGAAGIVLRRFDAVIGVNQELMGFFRRIGVASSRAHLTMPAPTVDLGQLKRERVDDPLQAFADAHDPLIMTVGLLEPEYDLQLQIHSLSALRDAHPEAGLLIVGAGSMHAELEELRAAHPCREHICIAGDVPHARTLDLMTQAGVLLRTTWYDGDAVSVREALQLGLPVIATDNGMRPEGVRLMPVGDMDRLVHQVTEALGDGPRLRSVTAGGRQGHEDDLERTVDLYKELVYSRKSEESTSRIGVKTDG